VKNRASRPVHADIPVARLERRWHAGKKNRTIAEKPARPSARGQSRVLVKQSHKTLLLWVLLIMMFLAIWQFLSPERPPATQVAFSEFMAQVHADKEKDPHVESVSIKDREYTFWVKDPKSNTKTKKISIGPENADEITKVLVDNKVAVSFEKEDSSPFWSGAIVTILPMVFLLVMFYLFMRRWDMQLIFCSQWKVTNSVCCPANWF
jgi:hypothetical protein